MKSANILFLSLFFSIRDTIPAFLLQHYVHYAAEQDKAEVVSLSDIGCHNYSTA